MELYDAIRGRRTDKAYTGRVIERAVLERMLDAAAWAPNHRMSQPWRFQVLDQAAVMRLIEITAADPAVVNHPDPVKGPAKFATMRERMQRCGAVVFVSWVRHADAGIDGEDRAAACAAVQNLLLAAHAESLASYWSTAAAMAHPATLRRVGIDPVAQGFVGAIWLGHPAGPPPAAPARVALAERARWVVL